MDGGGGGGGGGELCSDQLSKIPRIFLTRQASVVRYGLIIFSARPHSHTFVGPPRHSHIGSHD